MQTIVIFQDPMGAHETSISFDDDLVELLEITSDYTLNVKTVSHTGRELLKRYKIISIICRAAPKVAPYHELVAQHIPTLH